MSSVEDRSRTMPVSGQGMHSRRFGRCACSYARSMCVQRRVCNYALSSLLRFFQRVGRTLPASCGSRSTQTSHETAKRLLARLPQGANTHALAPVGNGVYCAMPEQLFVRVTPRRGSTDGRFGCCCGRGGDWDVRACARQGVLVRSARRLFRVRCRAVPVPAETVAAGGRRVG